MRFSSIAAVCFGLSCWTVAAWGQFAVESGVAVQPSPAIVIQQQPPGPGPAGGQPGAVVPPQGEAKPEEKPAEDKKDSSEAKEGEAKGAEPVKRPDKPPRTPDPREFHVKPGSDGRVTLAFNGQPWPDVLQWLASVSGLSLDWQELPGDYLNLTTQQPCTLVVARDLVNARLQARGYALLRNGDVLSVVKLDKLDPSQVPSVAEEDLYDLPPHDLVKVALPLPEGADPKQAVEDLKQTLSATAKLVPLAASNRVVAIDCVANLRMVSVILGEERLAKSKVLVPKRFVLKYARAEKVIDTLYVILGMDPASQPSQMELQVQQQKLQLLMQMQGSGADVSKMLNKDGPPVFLAFNRNENSVLVNAPREHMEIIERAIQFLDVPPPGSVPQVTSAAEAATPPQNLNGPAGLPEGKAASGNADAVRSAETYQLETMEPERLQATLEEIGDLDPLTELRSDNKAKILFARAPKRDHDKIRRLIGQLDGARDRVEVFYLRKHPADAVAGTVLALIGEVEEKDGDNNNRPYWYYGFNQQEEEEPQPKLRVDADVENNRLIVRGNDQQIEQVRTLLEKIGEIVPRPGSKSGEQASPVVVLDPMDPEATAALLEKVRTLWPSVGGGTALKIDSSQLEELSKPEAEESPATEPDEALVPAADQSTLNQGARRPRARFASETAAPATQQPAAQPPGKQQQATAQPHLHDGVTLTVTPDGRIVLGGADPAAVAKLEDLVGALAPPAERFRIFPVRYATAFSVWLNLTEYFEEDMKEEGDQVYDWWSDTWRKEGGEKSGSRLSRRRKLRLIYDTPTETILVANASAGQLAEIERLIQVYDRPAPTDSVKSRRTAAIKVRFSQAKTIAAAIKEVYRDLLSSRDKEFEDEDKKAGSTKESTTIIRYGGASGDSDGAKKSAPMKVGFEGALSIGVDDIANVLIVSAQEELFDGVVEMIRVLDEQAKPTTTVEVRQVSTAVKADALRKALAEALGTPWVGGKPLKPEQENKEGKEGEGKEGQEAKPDGADGE